MLLKLMVKLVFNVITGVTFFPKRGVFTPTTPLGWCGRGFQCGLDVGLGVGIGMGMGVDMVVGMAMCVY